VDVCVFAVGSKVGADTVNVGFTGSVGIEVGNSVGTTVSCTTVGVGTPIVGTTIDWVGGTEQPARTSAVIVIIQNNNIFGCITIYMFRKGM